MTKLPVLLVLHQEHSTPGRVGQVLRNLGFPLDIRRPRFDDPLPETLEQHAGAVVFGGPMSANDSDAYIRREIDWMDVPLRENKPFLGICLGAQMLARNLGGTVYCHAKGAVEVGYYPIRPTELGRAVGGEWPEHVYEWHREGFDLPPGADLLAEGDAFPVQAFRSGPAGYGIQFHPEVTHAMMCRWTTHGAARLELPGAKPRSAHFADRPAYDYAIRMWLTRFLGQWSGHDAQVATAEAAALATPRADDAGRAAERAAVASAPA